MNTVELYLRKETIIILEEKIYHKYTIFKQNGKSLSCNKRNFLDPPLHLVVFSRSNFLPQSMLWVYMEKRTHKASFCRSSHLSQLGYSNRTDNLKYSEKYMLNFFKLI